jgi:phosphatidylinositol glycan class S
MAEIAGDEAPTPHPPPPISGEVSRDPYTSTPASTGSNKPPLRTTKPGVKRLILTTSVLLSFLVGTTHDLLYAMASVVVHIFSV